MEGMQEGAWHAQSEATGVDGRITTPMNDPDSVYWTISSKDINRERRERRLPWPTKS